MAERVSQAQQHEDNLQRMLLLPNDGANATNDLGELRMMVDEVFAQTNSLVNSQNSPEVWTEFLATYGNILMGARGLIPRLLAPHIHSLIMDGLTSVVALIDSDDADIMKKNPPSRFKNFLVELKHAALLRRAEQGLFQNQNIDLHSRLFIDRRETVEGEITRIEYRAESTTVLIWSMGTEHHHNLPMTDELEVAANLVEDTHLSMDLFPSEVQEQFKTDLLEIIVSQIDSQDELTKLGQILELSGIGGNRGEMIFQQGIFPPFAFIMLSAASDDAGKTYAYIADQEATGSSLVVFEGRHYVVNGQPDSALLMPGSKDPIAMMKLKPENELNHQDLAKCIIWSSITGQALVRAGAPRDEVRVPFLIGSSSFASLFVAEFVNHDEEEKFCPSVSCMYDRLSLLSKVSRKKLFAALVLLIGRLKHQIRNLPSDAVTHLVKRRKTKKDATRNIFSKRTKRTSSTAQQPIGATDAQSPGTIIPGRQPSTTMQSTETGEVCNAAEHETKVMDAILMFCPEQSNLTYPWTRYRSIFGGDETEFYQQTSPFFFRGRCSNSRVFYKIWRHGDAFVDEALIQREVSLLRDARQCGISAPAILKYDAVMHADSLLYVLQMSDCGDHHFPDVYAEVLPYSLSLITNVSKLHSEAEILHCDLKPANVLWNGTTISLIDFGHAQKVGELCHQPGTTGYEAPEITQGHPNTRLTDAFSVGKVILAGIDRFTEKDETLLSVARRLCEPDSQRRLSLEDACCELHHDQRWDQPTAKRTRTDGLNSSHVICAPASQSIAA